MPDEQDPFVEKRDELLKEISSHLDGLSDFDRGVVEAAFRKALMEIFDRSRAVSQGQAALDGALNSLGRIRDAISEARTRPLEDEATRKSLPPLGASTMERPSD